MTTIPVPSENVSLVRCAEWTRANNVDPVGSFGGYRRFLLVDWPLPWPRDVGEIPEIAAVVDDMARVGGRVQCIVTQQASGMRRLVYFEVDEVAASSGSFARRELLVPAADVVTQARSLIAGTSSSGGTASALSIHDVLVCTHGKRDRCCGSVGTALAMSLQDGGLGSRGDVRIHRTSHVGGHRFAPTCLILPQATAWAFVDQDAIGQIVDRTGDVRAVLPRFRGYALHRDPAAQVLDRHAFGEIGWPWLDWARSAVRLSDDELELVGHGPYGERRLWRGRVVEKRATLLASCGDVVPLEGDHETEYELVEAESVS